MVCNFQAIFFLLFDVDRGGILALFLPDINNERSTKNATYKANFLKLRKLILVKAAKDTTVHPRESEWFGAYQDNSRSLVLLMNATTWYKDDSFGLRSLHSEGKIVFKTTPENHLQVSREDFMSWIDEFFRPDAPPTMKKKWAQIWPEDFAFLIAGAPKEARAPDVRDHDKTSRKA